MHGDVMLGTTTSICPQQDKYLYWDSNHPTAAANLVLGAEFAKAAAQ
jgi:phospholipase/lecithinase/hemolysin